MSDNKINRRGLLAAAAAGLAAASAPTQEGPLCKACGDAGRIVVQRAQEWRAMSWEESSYVTGDYPPAVRHEYEEESCPECG